MQKFKALAKFWLIFCTMNFLTSDTKAQSTEDSVKVVVNNLFAAMKNADASGLTAVFADSAILQTIATSKTGEKSIRTEDYKNFTTSIGQLKAGAADERISFETIKIDADLALVWTPYKFYYNGNFSHCGVNSFHLVRLKGVWKIQYLIDTRRKTPCEP